MNRLEQRYRLVLRTLLPASYRKLWEEDMVATFLESMDSDDAEAAEYLADFGRPSWSEVASVAALAVRLRLGAADAPLRSGARGEALRLVALMGLLVHAAAATIEAGSRLWLGGRVDWLAAPPGDWAPFLPHSAWPTISTIAGLLWLPAYVGLLLGHRRAAQLLAFLALLPATAAAISVTTDLPALAPLVLPAWANLLLSGLLVLALAAFHHDAPPVPRRPWLLALGVAIAVLLGLSPLVGPTTPWVLLDWPGLYCLALVGAGPTWLVRPWDERAARRPGRWPLPCSPRPCSDSVCCHCCNTSRSLPSGSATPCWWWAPWKPLPSWPWGCRWPGSPPTCCAASRRHRPPPPRHLHRPGSHQLSHASTLLFVGHPRLLAMGLAPPLLNRATRARCGRPPSHGLDPGP